MSELGGVGGQLPPNWGYPSPIYVDGKYQSDGMLWLGKEKATEADIQALKAELGEDVEIDEGTLCGTYTWHWIQFSDKVALLQGTQPKRMGGLGSQVYEYQLVGGGDGCTFRKESEGDMWYINTAGDLVYGIPPDNAGAYYKKYVGDGYYDNVEGVEQGSAADDALGRGEFYWDEKRRLYDVK